MFSDCIALHEIKTKTEGNNFPKLEKGLQFEAFNMEGGMQSSNGCEMELELVDCSRTPA